VFVVHLFFVERQLSYREAAAFASALNVYQFLVLISFVNLKSIIRKTARALVPPPAPIDPVSTTKYTYIWDNLGQRQVATSSVTTENRGYAYDTAWNLNYRTNNGALGTFLVDTKNELANPPASACTCGANGNPLTSAAGRYQYKYDDENPLTSWQDNGTERLPKALLTDFVYDGSGRLRERLECTQTPSSGPLISWSLASEAIYFYDGNRVIQERDGSNDPLVSYTRGRDLSGSLEGAGGIGGLLARSSGYSSGNWTDHNYYHADGNGNVTYLVDTSQGLAASYRYDPYGNTISSSGTLASANVYRFSSKECHVNSGMYYYGYRFYDPNLQRWTTRDPLGEPGFEELGGVAPTQTARPATGLNREPNLYEFVANGPVSDVDGLGLGPWGCPACFWFCRQYAKTPRPVFNRPVGLWVCGYTFKCSAFGLGCKKTHWMTFGVVPVMGATCPKPATDEWCVLKS
jgi:RHS repeat-associated protein